MTEATWAQLRERLGESVEPQHVKTKRQGGNSITFMPWYHIMGYLEQRLEGAFDWELVQCFTESGAVPQVGFDPSSMSKDAFGGWSGRLYMVGKLTIYAADRTVVRMASGCEKLSKESYGDAITSAEATCLRRAAAKCGFMIDLWIK